MDRRTFIGTGVAMASLLAGGTACAAQAWPTQVLRFVNPNVAGGTSDIIGRLVATPLGIALSQSVIVDSRPGGNGNVGAALVAQAMDGHTLLISDIPSLSISATLYKDLSYSLERDLRGTAMLAYSPHLFAVGVGMPVKNLSDLVALSKTRRINIALPFLGTPNHLAALELAQICGMRCQFVPYKGGAQALTDTVGGTADLVVTSLLPAIPLVQGGRLKAIGISKSVRTALLPGVPTLAEQGAPGFESGSWQGVTAPARMPADHVRRVSDELGRILLSPQVRTRLAELGAEPAFMAAGEMSDFITKESKRWNAVIAKAGGDLESIN